MVKPDIERLSQLRKQAKNIFVYGAVPIGMNTQVHKITLSKDDADLIIINSEHATTILNILQQIKHDCTIIICKFVDPSSTKIVQQFLDEHCRNFQTSRQMLIDLIKEQSLMIRHTIKQLHDGRNDAVTIFLVLKTGGPIYDSRYVNATARNIRNNITHNAEIVCITDNAAGITAVDRIVKMKHDWPKWWGKMELFRPDITQNKHAMYIDLDTVCLRNIDYMCSATDGFYGLRDFYALDTFQTGLLKWDICDATVNIYEQNKNDIYKYINKGDHELIGVAAANKKFLQDMFPGEICSYKKHLSHLYKNYINPSIICFHGDPRPHTVKHDLITSAWKY